MKTYIFVTITYFPFESFSTSHVHEKLWLIHKYKLFIYYIVIRFHQPQRTTVTPGYFQIWERPLYMRVVKKARPATSTLFPPKNRDGIKFKRFPVDIIVELWKLTWSWAQWSLKAAWRSSPSEVCWETSQRSSVWVGASLWCPRWPHFASAKRWQWHRHREGQRHRHREGQRQRDREGQRGTERDRDIDRERDREGQRQRDREGQRQRDREGQRHRHRDGQRHRQREGQRGTETERGTERGIERDRDREGQRQREGQRERETESDRDRERDRERQRQREGPRETETESDSDREGDIERDNKRVYKLLTYIITFWGGYKNKSGWCRFRSINGRDAASEHGDGGHTGGFDLAKARAGIWGVNEGMLGG